MKKVFIILFIISGVLMAQSNSLKGLYNLADAKTRSISPENFTGEKGQGGMSQEALMANARLVEKKLSDFNVVGEVKEVSTGPVITMYEYQPAPGVKISKSRDSRTIWP